MTLEHLKRFVPERREEHVLVDMLCETCDEPRSAEPDRELGTQDWDWAWCHTRQDHEVRIRRTVETTKWFRRDQQVDFDGR